MASELRTSGPDEARRAETRNTRPPGVRDASRRFDAALAAARWEGRRAQEASGGRPPVSRRCHRGGEAPGDLAGAVRALRTFAAPSPPAPAGAPAPGGGDLAAAPASAALRAAVRSLPPVIEAARLQDGARLALTLGGALGVELRGGAAGVEVTLRPEAALGRAAAAELPALVAALRARGVRVARAGLAPAAGRPPGVQGRQAR